MWIKRKRGWEISENKTTPESVYLNRRNLLIGAGAAVAAGAVGTAAYLGSKDIMPPAAAATPDPTLDLYPAMKDTKYTSDRPVTAENIAETYNNFYEYGENKDAFRSAGLLKTRPWTIQVDGLVDKPFTIGVDDLIRWNVALNACQSHVRRH